MCFLNGGKKIKEYRKLLRISQKEAAGNKVSHSMISLIECGKTNLTTVTAMMIADNLNRIAKEKGIDLSLSLKDFCGTEDRNAIQDLSEQDMVDSKESEEVNVENLLSLGCDFLKGECYEKSLEYFKMALELSLSTDEDKYIIESYKSIYKILKLQNAMENFDKYIKGLLDKLEIIAECKLKFQGIMLALKYFSDMKDYDNLNKIIQQAGK